jgi:hypothetical protein
MKFGNSVQIHGKRNSHKKAQKSQNTFVIFVPFCGYPSPLKPDIDTAFKQFGVLAELRVLGTETLIQ